MAKKDSSKKPKSSKPKHASKSVEFNLDGNVDNSVVVVGDKATVNYYAAVSANTKPNDPDFWNLKHPYPMPPNFTGRLAERATLTQWLDGDSENRLFILRALGGFGKSALAWQWLTHDVNPKTWKKVIFWSFYEGNASFEDFTSVSLVYLGVKIPQGGRPQVDELINAMQRDNILLIMDGFERVLRLYASMNAAYQGDEEEKAEENELDCKDMNAEWFLKGICQNPHFKSKVLMTTRLTPHAVKPRGEFMLGCCEVELTSMQKADAVQFFHKQGIQGNRFEIESACEPYGYHPLSLRLLAGRILKDFQHPGDISVAQKLKIDGDIIQQKHHVLEASYNSLPESEQKLLSTIACFRSPVEFDTLTAIVENSKTTENDLHDLVDRGLLYHYKESKRFDLHPIVRRYVYKQIDYSEKLVMHKRFVRYFDTISKPQEITIFADLSSWIELYHHLVMSGKASKALNLLDDKLASPIYYRFCDFQFYIELLGELLDEGWELKPEIITISAKALFYNELANAYAMSGQPRKAEILFNKHTILRRENKDTLNIAVGLGNIAGVQFSTGSLKDAISNFQNSIEHYIKSGNDKYAAFSHQELGRVLSYCGLWKGAKRELNIALDSFKKEGDFQGLGIISSYKAINYFLVAKEMKLSKDKLGSRLDLLVSSAIQSANQSMQLAKLTEKEVHPYPQDYARAYWVIGITNHLKGDLVSSEENLTKAINKCREINLVDIEAAVLIALASLRYDQNNYEEAKSLAEEALTITERCGYVLQGADVNLFLAQYALEQEQDKAKAKVYAEEAKKLATCDGPPYYYKVAYEEAEAMLKKLSK